MQRVLDEACDKTIDVPSEVKIKDLHIMANVRSSLYEELESIMVNMASVKFDKMSNSEGL